MIFSCHTISAQCTIIETSDLLCPNTMVDFTATCTGGGSRDWSSDDGSNTDSGSGMTFSVMLGDTPDITISVSNDGGATTLDSVFVLLTAPSLDLVVTDPSFCPGESATITIEGAEMNVNYELFDGGSSQGSMMGMGADLDFMVSPGSNTTYTVTATSSDGCSGDLIDEADVVLNDLPDVSLTVDGPDICMSDADATIVIENSELDVSYQLYTGGVAFESPLVGTGSDLIFTFPAPSVETTYFAEGTTPEGCSAFMADNGVVSFYTNSTGTVTAQSPGAFCQNSSPEPTITFSGSGGPEPYTFTYDGPLGTDLMIMTSGGSDAVINQPTDMIGTFTYTLTSIMDGNGCEVDITGESALIAITGGPTAMIGVDVMQTCQDQPSPVITMTASGGTAPYTFTYDINSSGSTMTEDSNGSGVATLDFHTI